MRYAVPLLFLSAGTAHAGEFVVVNRVPPPFEVVNTIPSACPGGCPLDATGAGGCGSKTCPGRGWNGPCPCSAPEATTPADGKVWNVRDTNGVIHRGLTTSQARVRFPNVTFPGDAGHTPWTEVGGTSYQFGPSFGPGCANGRCPTVQYAR